MKSANSSTDDNFSVGKRYDLQKTLGSGVMGVVYQAVDLLTGNRVALKQVTLPGGQLGLSPQANTADLNLSLAQEFRALASIRHPNIISVIDFGFDQQGQPYFTMEFVDGGQNVLDAGGMLTYEGKAK